MNKTYRQPKTVTQLAKEIGLSQPAIYKHVQELLASDMLQEADLPEEAFTGTSLENRGYQLEDILDFLYSKIRRIGRQVLDEQGFFPELPTHQDGSRWVYWAEEIDIEEGE